MTKVWLMGYGKAGQRLHKSCATVFPYQTLRIIHNLIERKAFGTGTAFALTELPGCSKGFHTFDDRLMKKTRSQLAQA